MNLPDVQLAGIAPELALVVAAFVVLIAGALLDNRAGRVIAPVVAAAGLVAAGALAIVAWRQALDSGPELQLSGMIAVDGFSGFCKTSLAIFGLLTVVLASVYFGKAQPRGGPETSSTSETREALDPEFYGLMLFAAAGMMLMAAAADLIVVFLALETFSISLYVLVGFNLASLQGQESAMKYFLLGAFSSAFFLLGIAIAYGAAGSTRLYPLANGAGDLASFLRSTPSDGLGLMILASGLLIVGLGFKVAAVPFHMWTPDAYQGAPSPVTGFMAAGSKLAGFAALLRLLDSTLFALREDWRPLVLGIAAVTMVVGSVLAVVQEDLKRILAYSSIAHAGFVFTGIIAANDDGVSGALFYLATYGITVLGAFAVVSLVAGRSEERVRLNDYRGLFFERPLLAGALTLFLLSLAGVPLTSGFVGKLLVFGAAIEAGYAWIAVVGVLASAIAAFFYLRVLVVMYMQEPEGEPTPLSIGAPGASVVGLAAAATVGLGLFWGPLIDVAERATILFG
jgi:NADH-quinone oxidoreductase subunit N